ncbi:MAG: bifunctional phosphoribosylaminoimidazolecarboxamide formyltransferase/IMP cyclohydrolase [Thermomicrobiales bacterium]|nr:bifunctional phosphoribosylaminoimidazolecarboxamide formyltransferase/IMP cyclohydrolase [Thermomicrobiales bacterium]
MRALLSVWDKTGIANLAERLHDSGVEIISTGGTLTAIEERGVPVVSVSDVTGFPELIGGRVKTLHPAIHGGLLARRDLAEHMDQIAAHDIAPIEIVVGNLYPFDEVVARPDTELEEALEHIDIGGPAMIRAAAKNFPGVVVIVNPGEYEWLAATVAGQGMAGITLEKRRELAATAFAHVSAYDAVVAAYLRQGDDFPQRLTLAGAKLNDLRYGENPHQRAAVYSQMGPGPAIGVGTWQLHSGKEMSFNNYLDTDAARATALAFSEPTVAIIKHANPCGVASSKELARAYATALDADPVSAFGGVVAANRTMDQATAELIASRFFEVVVAPGYDREALATLTQKKNVRIIEAPGTELSRSIEIRPLDGGFLAQDRDLGAPSTGDWTVVTEREPSAEELRDLEFAWRVVRHVKSNAIVMAKQCATVGIGGGQPNRVDAVRIAAERAGDRARGAVLASDAFFPFPDGLEAAVSAGVHAVVQPGGSVRDAEVIASANQAGIAMVFTGMRHFRH